jgi:hypothetical protein
MQGKEGEILQGGQSLLKLLPRTTDIGVHGCTLIYCCENAQASISNVGRDGKATHAYVSTYCSSAKHVFMKKHTRVYLEYFRYTTDDFIGCEVCGSRAVDIHHIDCRGMGGSRKKDTIDNLMALCRSCHLEYGDKKGHVDFLNEVHLKRICK